MNFNDFKNMIILKIVRNEVFIAIAKVVFDIFDIQIKLM